MSDPGKAWGRSRKLRDRANEQAHALWVLKMQTTPQQQIWYAAELLTMAAETLRDGGLALKALHIAELSQALQPGRTGTAAPSSNEAGGPPALPSGAAGSDLPPTAASSPSR